MRKTLKLTAAVFAAVLALSGITAFAQSNEPTPTNEIVLEDNRNLTPKGNAELVDDVTDNEDLQFITVTARDGNVFYFVIDRGATSENVYFLNTVDESDLAALTEEKEPKAETPAVETPKPDAEPEQEKPQTESEKQEPEQKTGNGAVYVILILAAVAGIGGYYFKVILPKKKLEQADDIEDFDFEDDTVNEDESNIDETEDSE